MDRGFSFTSFRADINNTIHTSLFFLTAHAVSFSLIYFLLGKLLVSLRLPFISYFYVKLPYLFKLNRITSLPFLPILPPAHLMYHPSTPPMTPPLQG